MNADNTDLSYFETNCGSLREFDENKGDYVENFVISNLDVIVLSILSQHEASCYELDKEVFSLSNILLDQGFIESVLHHLKENGALETKHEISKMETKKYYTTLTGKKLLHERIKKGVQFKYNHRKYWRSG